MKRMTKILTAALMTSSFAAAPALAGSVGVDAGATIKTNSGTSAAASSGSADASTGLSADTTTGSTELGVNTAADTTSRADASNGEADILAAISANDDAASDISTMADASTVKVVDVNSAAGASADKIDQALSQNETAVSDLRTSLQANAGVWDKLEAKGVELSSVVAAKTTADGSLTVYVR